MPRRIARIVSTALLTAGLVVLLDVGLTLAWSEPLSTMHGWLQQREAADQLERLERRFEPRRPDGLDAGDVRRLADRLAARAKPGDAIGRLKIPAIGLNIVAVEGTDTESLKRGPGHYPETAFPGQPGTVAVAGHRTTYLAPFKRINELELRDEVVFEMPYATFTYRFEKQRIVDPSRIGVIRDVDHERIVLTACHPLYSAAQRIVVFARLVDVDTGAEPAAAPDGAGPGPGPPGLGPVWAGLAGLALIALAMSMLGRRRTAPAPA